MVDKSATTQETLSAQIRRQPKNQYQAKAEPAAPAPIQPKDPFDSIRNNDHLRFWNRVKELGIDRMTVLEQLGYKGAKGLTNDMLKDPAIWDKLNALAPAPKSDEQPEPNSVSGRNSRYPFGRPSRVTPLRQQYLDIKGEYPEADGTSEYMIENRYRLPDTFPGGDWLEWVWYLRAKHEEFQAAADRVIAPLRPPDPTPERKLEVDKWVRHPDLPHAMRVKEITDTHAYLTYPGSPDDKYFLKLNDAHRCEFLSPIEVAEYEIALLIDHKANLLAQEIEKDIALCRIDLPRGHIIYSHRAMVKEAERVAEKLRNKAKRQVAPATREVTPLTVVFQTNGSVKVVKKAGLFELRGYTKPIADKLAAAGATWEPKLLCWTVEGKELPEGINTLLNELKTVQ